MFKRKICSIIIVLSLLLSSMVIAPVEVVQASPGSDLAANLTLFVNNGNTSVDDVLGITKNIPVTITNSNSAWIYNLNLTLELPSGLEVDPASSQAVAPFSTTTTGSQVVIWKDIKDLAPAESFTFYLPVTFSDKYRDSSGNPVTTDVAVGAAIAAGFSVTGSNDPHLYDTAGLIQTASFTMNAMPFEVTVNSPGKQVKGAGWTTATGDDYNSFPYTIDIVNNTKYPSTIDTLSFVMGNAIQVGNFSTAPATSILSTSTGCTTINWNPVSLLAGGTSSITFDGAIFNEYTTTTGGAATINNGEVIPDGTNIDSTLSYRGYLTATPSAHYPTITPTTLTSTVTAKDMVISKSVSPSSNIGYGSQLDYTIDVKTNQYYNVNNVLVGDTLGDGQTYIPASANPAATVDASVYGDGTTGIGWSLGTLNAQTSTPITLSSTVNTNWRLHSGAPIVANDTISNSVNCSGIDLCGSYNGTPSDGASCQASIKAPQLQLEFQNKQSGSINTGPFVGDDTQVQVGDKLTYKLTYDASTLNTEQKNVSIVDFFPEGTTVSAVSATFTVSTGSGDVVCPWTDSSVTTGGAISVDFTANSTYFQADFDEIKQNVKLSVVYELTVTDSSIITDQKQAFNLAKISYENTDAVVDSQRQQIGLVYDAPMFTIDKTADYTSGVTPGQTINFTITVTNTGHADAYDVNVVDILPAGFAGAAQPVPIDGGVWDSSAKSITYLINSIPYGQTVLLHYAATVDTPVGAHLTLTNTASVQDYKKTSGGVIYNDNGPSKSLDITTADPTISKTIIDESRANPSIGDWVVYKVTTTVQAADLHLYNSYMQDDIPSNQSTVAADVYSSYDEATHTGVTTTSGVTINSNQLKIDTGDLCGVVSKDFYYKTTIISNTASTNNTAYMYWYDQDSGGSQHSVNSNTSLIMTMPVLTPTWNRSTYTMIQSSSAAYTFTITNSGGNTAYDFIPYITMPDGLDASDFKDALGGDITPVDDSSDGTTRTITFPQLDSLSNLSGSKTWTATMNITLNSLIGAGTANSITGYTGDYYTTDSGTGKQTKASAITTVNTPGASIAKTILSTDYGSTTEMRPYDTITYNIAVTIPQGTDAWQVQLNDVLPSGLSLDSNIVDTTGNDVVSHATTNFIISDHIDASVSSVVYNYNVIARVSKTYTFSSNNATANNTATLSWNKTDHGTATSVSSSKSIKIIQPQLSIAGFTSDKTTFNSTGEAANFSFSLSNTGVSTANAVKVYVTIPSGVIFDSSDYTYSTTDGSHFIWIIPAINKSTTTQAVNFVLKEDGNLASPSNGNVTLSILDYYSTPDTTNSKHYGPVGPSSIYLNQPPTVPNYSISVNEDASVSGTIVATDIEGDTKTYSVFSGVTNGTLSLVSTSGAYTYTPTHDYFGSDSFTVTVSDGHGGTVNSLVSITVNPVNDVPSFTKGPDEMVYENAGPQTFSAWATALSVGPSNESSQTLNFAAANDNNGLFSVQPFIAPNGTLTFTPVADTTGTAVVTVVIFDDGGTANGGVSTSAAQTFMITVGYVNQVPKFTVGDNQSIPVNSCAQSISGWATGIAPGPANEAYQSVNFIIENNDNTALFSVLPAVSSIGTLTYTPASGITGTATITLKIHDDAGTDNGGIDTSTSQSFTITINHLNQYLTVPNYSITVNEDSSISGTIGATDLEGNTVTYSSTGVAHGTLSLVSTSGAYTYTPSPDYFGSDSFTSSASDGHGGTVNSVVSITVNPVNDRPSFTKGPDENVLENAGPQTFSSWATSLSVGPANEAAYPESQTLVDFEVTNDNNGLFSTQPAIDTNGELTFTPATDTSGSAVVTVILRDSGGTSNGGLDVSTSNSFVITVEYVNQIPFFTIGSNQSIPVNSGAQTVTGWATDISPGRPAIEAYQLINFIVSTGSDALFSVQPAVSTDGALTFTPVPGATGTATITVTIHDNGGTDNGGIDTSSPQSFTITIYTPQSHSSGDEEPIPPVVTDLQPDDNTNVLLKTPNGQTEKFEDYTKMHLVDTETNGNPADSPVAVIDNTGHITVTNTEPGKKYDLDITYEIEPGVQLVLGHLTIDVDSSGNSTVSRSLIDPYGIITDTVAGEVVDGAKVELFYADTQRNKDKGLIPDTSVVLPKVPGFEPNDNANPQITDEFGKYAYMVFPDTDYYITTELPGFKKFTSPIISVAKEMVKLDVSFEPTEVRDVAVFLNSGNTKIKEDSEFQLDIKYFNKRALDCSNSVLSFDVPDGFSVVDSAEGTVNGNKITWSLGTLNGNTKGVVSIKLKSPTIDTAEEIVSFDTHIRSSDRLFFKDDDDSLLKLLIYSNRYTHLHTRYIVGYTDNTFKPDRSITRAEVAAIFARIMNLKSTVTGEKFYKDVDNHWAAQYIEAVTKVGLFSGYPGGYFMPDKSITRAELATVIARFLGTYKSSKTPLIEPHFNDIDVSYAKNCIEELYRFGIVKGYGNGEFNPDAQIKRTETVVMINRMLFRGPLGGVTNTFPDMTSSNWAFGDAEESIRTHESVINDDGTETITKFISEPSW